MVSDDHHFVFDVARNDTHRVPDGYNPRVDCAHSMSIAGITHSLCEYIPWLTNDTVRFKPPLLISFNRIWAFAQESGRLGMPGMLDPSVRVVFS